MQQWHELETLKGFSLQARDGDIGTITDVWFDDDRWTMRYLVVRTGGWMMGREVLIAPTAIRGTNPAREQMAVDLTREQVETSPTIDSAQPVSRHYESRLHHHYGWMPYWTGGSFGVLGSMETDTTLPPEPREPVREPPDPHLRSSNEVRGYGMLAIDGEIGQVVDFIIQGEDWSIHYLVVDTRKWLPGRKVLLAAAWVHAIRWSDREIAVDLPRVSLNTAPQYQGPRTIDKRFELQLHQHYGVALKHTQPERA